MKYFLQILISVIYLIYGFWFASDELRPELVGSGLVLITTLFLVDGVFFFISNWNRLVLVAKIKVLAFGNHYIRFSMSYQYRIKVKDKYLLVKNSNPNWNFYQHVGGKYKRYDVTQKILQDFEARDDYKMKTDGLKKGDFAVFIPAKNALKFIDWFNTGRDREISHWREFYEELLGCKASNKILSKENFPYVNYQFVKTIRSPLKKAPNGWDCWEMLQYDVLDLLPNASQQSELEQLLNEGDTDYIKWASAYLINSLGYDANNQETTYKIGPHAKWVLNLKWSKI